MRSIPSEKLFWAITPEETAQLFETDIDAGISEEEAEARVRKYGANQFGRIAHFSKTKLLLRQFKSPLIFILIAAASATLALHDWIDSIIILLAIVINTCLGFYQENRAENALAHLRSYLQERTRVVRDGKEYEVDAATLAIGDIIHLVPGSRVPADGRLISVQNLFTDESILTGEAMPIEKNIDVLSKATLISERLNMVFGGTLVTGGSARAVVVATGQATEIGKIAELVKFTKREQTPIQKALSRLSWIIAAAVLILVSAIFTLGFYHGEPLLDMFLVSIAVAVGAIPEALPVALTAVLAVGVEQLARKKGIMRDLTAAETLGSTTVIMTDKTGTLTEASMQLIDIQSGKKLLAEASSEATTVMKERFSAEQKDILYLAAVNTDVLIENPEEDAALWRMSGNPLEKNIMSSAAIHGIAVAARREQHAFQMLLPFNSINKFSVSHIKLDLDTTVAGKKRGAALVLLGAPDVLLARAALDKKEYLALLQRIEALSMEGKRVLGVAIAPGIDAEAFTLEKLQDIKFVGVLTFYDPVRVGVPQAIQKIEEYGVHVVIATGDIKGTAIAIAKDLGWNIDENSVLSGDELRQLDDKEILESLEHVRVFARMTPEDKLRIAQLYQKQGEVVAMTGDGVNDAPSLKAVNIGIAVGSGTDVAKGVADLVLLDDNFETIVAAIEEGKRILSNLRKTFVYLLSGSLDEVVLIGGSLLVGLSLPLTAIQIIWVNLFTGSLPSIAFAFDRDTDIDVIENIEDKKILNNEVKFLTLGIGTFTSFLLFALYYGLMQTAVPESEIKTFLFACFSSYILLVAFSFRNLDRPIFSYNPFSNRFLNIGVATGLALLCATLYIPYLQEVFSTVTLGPAWLALIVLWVLFNIVLVECAKWLFYKNDLK